MPSSTSHRQTLTLTPAPSLSPISRRQLGPTPMGFETSAAAAAAAAARLTRLLVNVTVEASLWPVHVVLSAESTVTDLVRAALRAYVAEGRRPPLPSADPAGFELHFSKYSLESLRPEEKVVNLGSRNFFLCSRRTVFNGGKKEEIIT